MLARTSWELERSPYPKGERPWSQVDPITSDTGKWVEGKEKSDGDVVVLKQGNACGAKVPYW